MDVLLLLYYKFLSPATANAAAAIRGAAVVDTTATTAVCASTRSDGVDIVIPISSFTPDVANTATCIF